MEAHLSELSVVLVLHLTDEEGCILSLCHSLFATGIQIYFAEAQCTGKVYDRQIVVAAEDVEENTVLRELQVRLEGVGPSNLHSLYRPTTVGVPIKSFQDDECILGVG